MTWANHSKALQTEVDKFQWAARIHLQCLESAIRRHLAEDPDSSLKARVRECVDVYIEEDEQYGVPPDLFSESFREAVFEPENRLKSLPE